MNIVLIICVVVAIPFGVLCLFLGIRHKMKKVLVTCPLIELIGFRDDPDTSKYFLPIINKEIASRLEAES